MTDPPLSTMASSEAADPSRANPQACNSTADPPAPQASKNFVTSDFDLTIRAFFPPPTTSKKFNPIHAMTTLFRTMLKDEPSLVLRTPSNDKQLILATASLPTGEKDFKTYFKVSTARSERKQSSHVCIGFHVMSSRSLGSIKFKSKEGHLLTWLKNEKVFLESDGLGTDRPVTLGYLTKIAADITHLKNFRDHLANQLMLIDIDADTAVDLAPHLKEAQIEAMSNGDEYAAILPEFEIYRTRLTHGREPSQVTTDVLGIKCAPRDAKLMTEFLTRLASETNKDQRDGVFVPKGAVHLLGPQTYEQILKDNNFFLTTVATVPINLEYRAWFVPITVDNASENDPLSLYDHLMRKPWFLRIEEVDRRKCIIVTTKPNLPEAREWTDNNLEPLIRQSIPAGIEAPISQLPRRLDKPVYSASSKSYAEALKQQFSLASNTTPSTTDHMRPPRKRQAASIIDYDSDSSNATHPTSTIVTTSTTSQSNSQPLKITTTNHDYATELQSIKMEINALKTMLSDAVAQFQSTIASVTASVTAQKSPSNDMDTEADAPPANRSTEQPNSVPNSPDLSAVINDLKNEIAAFVCETRAMFQARSVHLPPFELTPFPTRIS